MLRWFDRLSHFIILQFTLNALNPFDFVNGANATSTPPPKVDVIRRQAMAGDPGDMGNDGDMNGGNRGQMTAPPRPFNPAGQVANRFSTKTTNTNKYDRTPPERSTYEEQCDLLANYCLKAYDTGRICGKTIYQRYLTFKNYCMLDYVNCVERYEMWQLVHMGHCYQVKLVTEYIHYPYEDDFFLDRDYVVDDQNF